MVKLQNSPPQFWYRIHIRIINWNRGLGACPQIIMLIYINLVEYNIWCTPKGDSAGGPTKLMKNYQLFTFWWFKSLYIYPALTNIRPWYHCWCKKETHEHIYEAFISMFAGTHFVTGWMGAIYVYQFQNFRLPVSFSIKSYIRRLVTLLYIYTLPSSSSEHNFRLYADFNLKCPNTWTGVGNSVVLHDSRLTLLGGGKGWSYWRWKHERESARDTILIP